MKQIKKIVIVFLIVAILTPTLCPFSKVSADASDGGNGVLTVKTPGLTQEQQDYIAQYVRIYLNEAYTMDPRPFVYDSINGNYEPHYRQNEWPITKLGQSGVTANGTSYSNRMRTVCSVFTASMLHQALGVEIWDSEIRGAGFSNPDGRGKEFFNKVQDGEPLQPGDIISWGNYAHSMIYIGCDPKTGEHQIAETCGGNRVIGINKMEGIPQAMNNNLITPEQIRAWAGTRMTDYGETQTYGHVARLKPEIIDPNWKIPEVTKIQWPNGTITEWSGEIVSTKLNTEGPMWYQGIAEKIGILGETRSFFDQIVKAFSDIIDYLIGLVTMIIRIPFVGVASVAERLVTAMVNVTSTEAMDSVLTLEKIVYNQVPLFDINLFDMEEAGGQELSDGVQSQSIILSLRKNVAGWYVAFRNFVIVALLLVLLYLGIRMAMTSIAEEKAEYKRMLVDWFISFFMVLFIHYFLIAMLELNDFFIGIFYKQMQGSDMGSLYETMNEMAHSAKFTDGWYGTIMYIALVWFMVKYAWKYAKRLLSAFILVILSPLVAISYAIDKIKDNRSQSLSKWLKEIAFTVLIQSVHALVYTVFMVGIVANIANNNNLLETIGVCVFLVIAIKFMDAAEDIFENIFGFKSSDSLKEIMNSSFEAFGTLKIVKNWAMGTYKAVWTGGKIIGKATGSTVNFGAKHIKPVRKLKETYEDIREGYKEAVNGNQIDDTPTVTSINKTIEKRRADAASRLAKENSIAKKAWSNSTNIIKNFGKAMPALVENPMASITYFIAGGVATKEMIKFTKKNMGMITKEQRTIKQAKKDMKARFTGRRKDIQEDKLLCETRDKDIALRKTVDGVIRKRR